MSDTFLIALLVIVVIQAGICGIAAEKLFTAKGHPNGFAWGFWAGIVGVLVGVGLPDVGQRVEGKGSLEQNAGTRVAESAPSQPRAVVSTPEEQAKADQLIWWIMGSLLALGGVVVLLSVGP